MKKKMINIVIMISSIFLFVNAAAADSSKSKNIDGMVFIKGGCFQMGDSFGDGYAGEKPVHEVCVNDFYIGENEVTQGEWKVFMAENPSVNKLGDNYPVDSLLVPANLSFLPPLLAAYSHSA